MPTQRDLAWATGALFVLGAGAFWSTGGLLMRLIESADPWQILFYRSCAMALFFLMLLAFTRSLVRFRTGGWPLGLAGLCVAVASISFVFSITNTTVANTFFLLATQPLITAILAWWVLGERPGRRTWVAMAVAVAGVSFMVLDGVEQGTLFGNAMALVSAAGFAALTVTLRVHRALDMRPGIALGGLFTALLSAGALAAGEVVAGAGLSPTLIVGTMFSVPTRDLILCVASGTVQIGCGMLLYTLGTQRISAGEAALFALSEVLLAPVWVWVVVNEQPSRHTLTGGFILLIAIGIRAWPRTTPPPE